jgi:uncharacterized protein (DUF924 family)
MKPNEILHFWFKEITPEQWWLKDAGFDQEIKQRFNRVHHGAISAELFSWRANAIGRLAEIIVLDQFSRNIYRDTPRAFAYDSQALVLAQETIALGLDMELSANERSFIYLPYMHSESLLIHDQAIMLYEQLGHASNLAFEIKHREIIQKFGRYPHRNIILKRESTAEELAFLQQPDSSF